MSPITRIACVAAGIILFILACTLLLTSLDHNALLYFMAGFASLAFVLLAGLCLSVFAKG